MTVLFDANRLIPQGEVESAVFPLSVAQKRIGNALALKISMGAEQFPDGRTTIVIYLSTDGGISYRSGEMTVDMPTVFRFPAPNFWTMSFALEPNADPTHAKYWTKAPVAFTTRVIVEAL